jgi:hypothetical protein
MFKIGAIVTPKDKVREQYGNVLKKKTYRVTLNYNKEIVVYDDGGVCYWTNPHNYFNPYVELTIGGDYYE